MPTRAAPPRRDDATGTGALGPSRRAVGHGALVVGLAAVNASCGPVRWESAQPVTVSATRPGLADEPVLRAALARAERLSGLAALAPGQTGVAERHTRQARVCRALLAAAGLPTDGPPTGSPASATPVSSATVAELAAAEARRDAPGWAQLAAAQRADLHLSLAAHDAATALALGATLDWPPARLPVELAQAQLPAHRAAWYAAQVATARVTGGAREELAAVTLELRRRTESLGHAAGPTAGTEPLAYTLPFPVETEADARRLLSAVLGALVAQGLAGLPSPSATASPTPEPTGGAVDRVAAAVGVVRLLAEGVALAARNGVPTPALPGLLDPS